MKLDLNVNVHHLTRIEGHGDIKIRVKDGKLKEASWEVIETPRFFEVMFKNKHFTSVPVLASRICGICSISHTLTALRATENAFGVKIPETASKLRLLGCHGETLQSHYLHLFFLAAPDFFNEPSAIPLIEKKPAVIQTALRLKGLGNKICDLVAGRTTHPVSFQVGGVTRRPKDKDLLALRDELEHSLKDLKIVTEVFSEFKIPDFIRETEFVSLKGEKEYPFIGGDFISTDGVQHTENDYLSMTNEYVVDNNTSKWSKLSRESYAVGALARFNNNSHLLHPEAAKIAKKFHLKAVNHNPFMNNIAQLVECFQATYDAIRLIDEIIELKPEELKVKVKPKASEGIGAVEAPRGLLIHHYKYDKEGFCQKANCVVPSTQNNANIHYDLKEFVEKNTSEGMTDEKLEILCSMLVRAYDPCISCSVH